MPATIRRRWAETTAIVAILFIVVLQISSAPTATAASFWTVVSSPTPGANEFNPINAVGASSSSDVWMVGTYTTPTMSVPAALIEHWNGSTWSVVSSPTPAHSAGVALYGVAALSASDAWAAGFYSCPRGPSGAYGNCTLVEHWNGSAWSVVPSPNPGGSDDRLYAVAARSANDVWAVGSYWTGPYGFTATLIEHWNGSVWSVVASQNTAEIYNALYGITALAANDVWAVGEGSYLPLTEHWNGTSWQVVSNPGTQNFTGQLQAVAGASANDLWTVGYVRPFDSGTTEYMPIAMHWNGSHWTTAPTPAPGARVNYLNGLAVLASNKIWATGFYDWYNTQTRAYDTAALFEYWNGSTWQQMPGPTMADAYGINVYGAASVPGTNRVWAVGEWYGTTFAGSRTLVETTSANLSPPRLDPQH